MIPLESWIPEGIKIPSLCNKATAIQTGMKWREKNICIFYKKKKSTGHQHKLIIA